MNDPGSNDQLDRSAEDAGHSGGRERFTLRKCWRALTRGERSLLAASLVAGLLPLVFMLARGPAGGALWSASAVAMAHRADPGPKLPWAGRVSPTGSDPWGAPWRALHEGTRFTFVYSAGPNGIDEYGAGDDVHPGEGVRDPWLILLARPMQFTFPLALFLLWIATVTRQFRKSRSERFGVEFLRTIWIWISIVPTGVITGGVYALLEKTEALASLKVPMLLLPANVAVTGTVGVSCAALALGVRARRRPNDGAVPSARFVPGWVWPCLAGAALICTAWAVNAERRERHWDQEWVARFRLYALSIAQSHYREANDPSFRYGNLEQLRAAGLITPEFASGTQGGYAFELHLHPEHPDFMWCALATPLGDTPNGIRYLSINASGTVHFKDSPMSIRADCSADEGSYVMGR